MKASWLIIPALIVLSLLLVGGCGGHGGQVAPGGGGVGVATFVGRAVCATCHEDVDAEFGSYNGVPFVPGTKDASHVFANFVGSAHGQDMRSKGSGNRNMLDAPNESCRPCHTVGFSEPTGYTSSTDTPYLEGIGCEECHGKGSLHAGDPPDNINQVPQADQTCWDCHVGSYKLLRSGQPPTVTDTNPTLYDVLPKNIRAHQRQTPFLLGYLGYNTGQFSPSPHGNVPNTCVTCHLNHDTPDLANGHDKWHGDGALEVDFNACGGCHAGGPVAAENMLDDFEAEMNARLILLGGESSPGSGLPNAKPTAGWIHDYAVAHGIDDGTGGGRTLTDPDDEFVQRYKAARYDYDHIESSGFWHNPPFAEQLLDDADALVGH
jgi:hypothetical protein